MSRLDAGWKTLRSGFARLGRHLRRGAAAYGVLLIALFFTILAFYYVRQNVEAEARTRFDETTQATRAAIYRRVNANLAAMFGAAGLLIFNDSLGRNQWDNYVKIVTGTEPKQFSRNPGFQSLGFAQYVRLGESEAYSREAREEGVRDLWPKPKNGDDRSAYFPLKFVAPASEANRRMLGYDAY